jgi:hypothetical protein
MNWHTYKFIKMTLVSTCYICIIVIYPGGWGSYSSLGFLVGTLQLYSTLCTLHRMADQSNPRGLAHDIPHIPCRCTCYTRLVNTLKVDRVKRLIENSVVDPDLDPVGSGTFCHKRIRNTMDWIKFSQTQYTVKLYIWFPSFNFFIIYIKQKINFNNFS